MATSMTNTSSARAASLARRQAQSALGKRGTAQAKAKAPPAPAPAAPSRPAVRREAPRPAAAAAAPERRPGAVVSPSGNSRAQSMARRAALSRAGKKADTSSDRTRRPTPPPAAQPAAAESGKPGGCGCGCGGARREEASAAPSLSLSRGAEPRARARAPQRRASGDKPTGRALALARRRSMSVRGKAAASSQPSPAGLARQANPQLSGRELAQKVRSLRSKNGSSGTPKKGSASRTRPARAVAGADDQPWKVGTSQTAAGSLVTGTKVGRSRKTTGDEPSTCRPVTGTEYMGAEIFREFCQAEPPKAVEKVRRTSTTGGSRVTGTEVGRSTRVTGDEPGTCKNVTGTEYLSVETQDAFCGVRPEPGHRKVGQAATKGGKTVSGVMVGRSGRVTGDEAGAAVRPTGTQYTNPSDPSEGAAPPKVGLSLTLSGGAVTGTRVGRSERVTGDEPGSCRSITGDEYIDLGQYQAFCDTKPAPEPPKVGFSVTGKKKVVSGTQTGRSAKVTGDEPGTCKAVTGTPYAGLDQADAWCAPEQARSIESRTRPLAFTPGPRLSGMQPGIGGVMTGAERGACEAVTGTPYVGKDQFAEACGGNGASPGESDFPQPLEGAPWERFSVSSPARQAHDARETHAVTGTRYEQGSITGPFGMGTGKITGTEQFRFDRRQAPNANLLQMEQPAEPAAPAKSRITGEGQSAGTKITGDDWERGDRVTGTEGVSARRRNPTRPGAMGAMPPVAAKRNEEAAVPASRVTGSSGSTERGALVTYSGGARG